MVRRQVRYGPSTSRGCGSGRLLVALAIAAISLFSYFSSRTTNEITGETQYIGITPEQEIALGLQAVPEMEAQFGGELPDPQAQALLDQVCRQLLENSDARQTDWPFECTLLADPETINAFALPGGPTFITVALFNQMQTEGQLAGVMAHEIGHVIARHSAQQIAKQQLTQGLTGAAVIAAYDPSDPRSAQAAQIALVIGELVNMKFGREDELESDRLGVRFMAQAGYDPRAMLQVMEILAAASEGQAPPEFFSTHPNPDNRIENIQAAIAEEFPDGVPGNLQS